MDENADAGWTFSVSRRSILALPALFGLAGCTQLSSEYTQDHDPYLQAMKKDPMVLWDPPMAVTRTIFYSSKDDVTLEPGSSQTRVHIGLTPVDLQAVPDLLVAAKKARTQAGYSEAGRRYGGHIDGHDFWIDCFTMASTKDEVVAIILELRSHA